MAIPIAGASVGNTLRFGTAGVANVSATVAPVGWVSTKLGFSNAVFYADATGAAVWMAFEGQYSPPTAYNVGVTFGGYFNIGGASAGNQSKIGVPTVGNVARQLLVSSITPPRVGIPRAYRGDDTGIQDFEFTTEYLPTNSKNIGLYFGTGLVSTGLTLGNTLKFGLTKVVNNARLVATNTVGDLLGFGASRVGSTGPIEFAFDSQYTLPSTPSFTFGGAQVASAAPIPPAGVGKPGVRNLAQSIAQTGSQFLGIGTPRVYDVLSNGGLVEFSFLQDYRIPTALNTPFYVEGVTYLQVNGFDSAAYGQPNVWLYDTHTTTSGIPSSKFGTAGIARPPARVLGVPGLLSTEFGDLQSAECGGLELEFYADDLPADFYDLEFGSHYTDGPPDTMLTVMGMPPAGAGQPVVVGLIPSQQVLVIGEPDTAYGLPRIIHAPTLVYPSGIPPHYLGRPAVFSGTNFLFDQPNPSPESRTVFTFGIGASDLSFIKPVEGTGLVFGVPTIGPSYGLVFNQTPAAGTDSTDLVFGHGYAPSPVYSVGVPSFSTGTAYVISNTTINFTLPETIPNSVDGTKFVFGSNDYILVTVGSIVPATKFGQAALTTQWNIRPTGISSSTAFGVPELELLADALYPGSIADTEFGTPSTTYVVHAQGQDSQRFGVPTTTYVAFAQGTPSTTEFGLPKVGSSVAVSGIDSAEFGTGHAYCRITTTGIEPDTKFGTPEAILWARVVYPEGIESLGFDGSTGLEVGDSNTALVYAPAFVEFSAILLPPLVGASILYDPAVARPHVNATTNKHQVASTAETGFNSTNQSSSTLRQVIEAGWQQANTRKSGAQTITTYNLVHTYGPVSSVYQNAKKSSAYTFEHEGSALRISVAAKSLPHQTAVLAQYFSQARHQGQSLLRRIVDTYHQVADRVSKDYLGRYGTGDHQSLRWLEFHQNAIRPVPGSPIGPTKPPHQVCYLPDPNLVFGTDYPITTDLYFKCEGTWVGVPTTVPNIVVPVQPSYTIMNDVHLYVTAGMVELPITQFSVSLDMDSWAWGFSASMPGDQLDRVFNGIVYDPTPLTASVNGELFSLLAEKVSLSRSFGKSSISVSGRGLSAGLGAPYCGQVDFYVDGDKDYKQIVGQSIMRANNDTEPFDGWVVNSDAVDDWLVPANTWSMSGTYIDAYSKLAKACGGFLYPHPETKTLYIKPVYNTLPWDWAGLTTGLLEIPTSFIETEGIAWEDLPRYNSVYVAGVSTGISAYVKLASVGSENQYLAPMETHQLITDQMAARQYARPILARTGKIATLSLSMPVSPLTNGIIKPGQMIKYVQGTDYVLGLVRGVSVSMSNQVNLRQSVELETHYG